MTEAEPEIAKRLRERSKPGYGLDLGDSDRERANYWSGVAQAMRKDCAEAADYITAQEAEIAGLREALKPFAELGRIVLAEAPEGAETVGLFASSTGDRAKVALDDFRRARASTEKETR